MSGISGRTRRDIRKRISLSYEDTAEDVPLQTRKKTLSRNQIHQCLNLGLPSRVVEATQATMFLLQLPELTKTG